MIKLYDNNISSLRQSAKQRQSSLIAEQSGQKKSAYENYNLKQNSEYSTNVC